MFNCWQLARRSGNGLGDYYTDNGDGMWDWYGYGDAAPVELPQLEPANPSLWSSLTTMPDLFAPEPPSNDDGYYYTDDQGNLVYVVGTTYAPAPQSGGDIMGDYLPGPPVEDIISGGDQNSGANWGWEPWSGSDTGSVLMPQPSGNPRRQPRPSNQPTGRSAPASGGNQQAQKKQQQQQQQKLPKRDDNNSILWILGGIALLAVVGSNKRR